MKDPNFTGRNGTNRQERNGMTKQNYRPKRNWSPGANS